MPPRDDDLNYPSSRKWRDQSRRQEPTFDTAVDRDDADEDDFRLEVDDRPVPPPKGRPRREDRRPPSSRNDRRERAETRPRKKRRGFFASLIYWPLILLIWGGLAGAGALALVAFNMPQLANLQVPPRPPNIQIVDVTGQLIANRGDTGGEALKLEDMPQFLPEAVIATEDRKFYYHFGFDPAGLVRAVLNNVVGHGGTQGGSTLTQQLAKNLFLTPDRTLTRKLQELVLAIRLEMTYSKKQILEMYLNRVYMGGGAYGADAASRRYFGKSARDLDLQEAAVLAGLLKAPSRYAPTNDVKLSTDRAATVLKGMVEAGFVSQKEMDEARKKPLWVARAAAGGSGNYVADYVMDMLPGYVSSVPADLVVTTTIDLRLQRQADAALYESLQKDGARHQVSQGAIVSVDTSGAIRALVGGKSYADSQFNRATAARRQPGSSFKPFVYLTALEHGLTPDTVRVDEPVSFKGWAPRNFENKFEGPVTLTQALADSINTVAIRVAAEVGPKAVVATARRLGISSDLQPNLSIALGTSEVTPLEITAAYVPFANGGQGVIPYLIDHIAGKDGTIFFQRNGEGVGQVIDPGIVGEMNFMLSQTLISGTGRAAALQGVPAAGKTGTSQDFRDAWFIGYTNRLVTGVWVGNDDGTPTKRTTGGSLPAVIWHRVMAFATQRSPTQSSPTQTLPGLDEAIAIMQSRQPLPAGTTQAAPATFEQPQLQPAPSNPQPQPQYQQPQYQQPQYQSDAQGVRIPALPPLPVPDQGAANAGGHFEPPADGPQDIPDGLPDTPAPQGMDQLLLR